MAEKDENAKQNDSSKVRFEDGKFVPVNPRYIKFANKPTKKDNK